MASESPTTIEVGAAIPRVADGHLKGDAALHTKTEYVSLLDPEVPQQGGRVVGHRFVGDGAVDVGGVPVPLPLDRDHLAGLGQAPGTTSPIMPIVM
jgi:hypothetical protein